MSSLNGKSPITYLFELCLKKGLTPAFELEKYSGPVHQRIFEIKVTAGDFIGRGNGSRKKKAKHLAALEAIKQMLGDEDNSFMESVTGISGEKSPCIRIQINPVSELQEMTQKNHLPLPVYDFEMTGGGRLEERLFTCTVRLLNMTELGKGKSKKTAKREAAVALLNVLKIDDLSTKLDETLKSLTDEISIGDIRSAYQTLQEKQLSSYHGTSNGVHDHPLSSKHIQTYCDLLQELANESKFEITYVDLPESTYTGWFQCIIQLSVMPVVVCHGSGQSKNEAHANAALNALFCIGSTYDRSTVNLN